VQQKQGWKNYRDRYKAGFYLFNALIHN